MRAASVCAILLGVLMVLGGVGTWVMVSTTQSSQRITVSPDADCLANASVDNPLAAFCQARVIDKHTTEITGGKTYAELPKDDPKRATAMNSAFLQSSLFTSVLAYGVAAMAAAMGVLFVLIGMGIRDVSAIRRVRERETVSP